MKSTYAVWNMILVVGVFFTGCTSEPKQGFYIPEGATGELDVAMPQPNINGGAPATGVGRTGTTLTAEHFPNSDFFAQIQDSRTPVVVDFTATWCGPCQDLKPILSELEQEGKVKVVMIDIDANPAIADKFGVNGIPHMMFVKDGKIAENVIGFNEKEALEAILNRL